MFIRVPGTSVYREGSYFSAMRQTGLVGDIFCSKPQQ